MTPDLCRVVIDCDGRRTVTEPMERLHAMAWMHHMVVYGGERYVPDSVNRIRVLAEQECVRLGLVPTRVCGDAR